MAKRLQRPQNKRRSAAVIAVTAAVALVSVAVAFMLCRAEAQRAILPPPSSPAPFMKRSTAWSTRQHSPLWPAASSPTLPRRIPETPRCSCVCGSAPAGWTAPEKSPARRPPSRRSHCGRTGWTAETGCITMPCPWSRDRAPRCSVNLCGWEPLFRPPARLCTSR